MDWSAWLSASFNAYMYLFAERGAGWVLRAGHGATRGHYSTMQWHAPWLTQIWQLKINSWSPAQGASFGLPASPSQIQCPCQNRMKMRLVLIHVKFMSFHSRSERTSHHSSRRSTIPCQSTWILPRNILLLPHKWSGDISWRYLLEISPDISKPKYIVRARSARSSREITLFFWNFLRKCKFLR